MLFANDKRQNSAAVFRDATDNFAPAGLSTYVYFCLVNLRLSEECGDVY